MLSKALAVAALAGAVAAQNANLANGDTGHVDPRDRVIQGEGDVWDIDSPDRDNWKREEIDDGW